MAIDTTKATLSFSEIELPEQKLLDFNSSQIRFPGVLVPTTTPADLDFQTFIQSIKSNKSRVEELLYSSGAVLLRGFPVTTASEFNDVVEAFGYEEFPYVGGAASRTRVVGRVFTANESPPGKKIPFHHEMSHAVKTVLGKANLEINVMKQLPKGPSKLFFFCEMEPKSGGETPLILSNLLYEMMFQKHPDFVQKLEEEGLLSSHFMGEEDDNDSPIGRSWKSVFSTEDKTIAEERASKMGMSLEWVEGGAKTKIGPFPPFRIDKTRGNKTWYNSLLASYVWKDSGVSSPNSITFGDGTPLPSDTIYDCMRMVEEECVAIPWKRGDVLLLDNLAVLHSRRSFEPPRRILASFVQ